MSNDNVIRCETCNSREIEHARAGNGPEPGFLRESELPYKYQGQVEPVKIQCPKCRGTGGRGQRCDMCNGSGSIPRVHYDQRIYKCPDCNNGYRVGKEDTDTQ